MADYNDLAYSLSGFNKAPSPYEQRRKMGYGLIQAGMDSSPILSPWQGASRLAQALVGSWMAYQAGQDENTAKQAKADELGKIAAIADPQERVAAYTKIDPEIGMRYGAQLAVEQAKKQYDQQALRSSAESFGSAYGVTPQGPQQAQPPAGSPQEGVGTFESGNNYGAVNPKTGAAGKYQVIPANIGPWTKQYYGQELTPEQFLKNPQAQEAVFQGKFVGEYLPKYGQQGARAAWFAGEGGMNNPNATDANGVNVAQYVQRTGGGQYIPQGSSPQPAPGQPPAPSPQMVTGPTVMAQPPDVPNVPRPTPTPQMLQQYQQRLVSGEFGQGPEAVSRARAALDADLDRQWNVDRDVAKMRYEAARGDIKQSSADTQQTFTNTSKLRDEYRTEPVVKQYRTVVPMLESAKDAATRPTRAADINLVYAFAKLMDPDSVVRESETGMVTATGSVVDRIGGLLSQLSGKGQMLQPETRAKLIAELDSRFKTLDASYQQITDAYRGIAQSGGFNPDHIILPIRPGEGRRQGQGDGGQIAAPGAAPPGPPAPPPGFKVVR